LIKQEYINFIHTINRTLALVVLGFKEGATEVAKDNYYGMLHTVWTSAENAIEQFYGRKDANSSRGGNWVEAFKALYDELSN